MTCSLLLTAERGLVSLNCLSLLLFVDEGGGAAVNDKRDGVRWGGDATRSVLDYGGSGIRTVSYGWGCG